MNQNDTIAIFIRDVKQILVADPNEGDVLERIAERMQKLVADPSIRNWQEEPVGNIHSGQQPGPLYQDESGLTLMHARFGSETMTPIHNHNSWAIVSVYRGRDLYQKWRRSDSGNGAGNAQVELIEERVLEPGASLLCQRRLKIFTPSKALPARQPMNWFSSEPTRLANHGCTSMPYKASHTLLSADRCGHSDLAW